jgi:hypothetical protein
MWAGGYALRPNLVFDTGLVRGFLNDSTRWELASGVTYVLPHRLWGGSRPPSTSGGAPTLPARLIRLLSGTFTSSFLVEMCEESELSELSLLLH